MIATATPDFLHREPEAVYRKKAKDFLSSHALADFRKCPLLYRKKQLGLIADEDSSAFVMGRAAHTLILEGRTVFESTYAIGGPLNERTGKPFGTATKAWAEWAEAQGRPVLSHEQLALVQAMAAGVAGHADAKALLADGMPEGVVRATYGGLPCQSRMDWFNPAQGVVDLKTCDDLTWFEADGRRFGYAYQMAFYRALLREVSGQTHPVHVIAVEKREPYRCGVWRFPDEVLAIAEKENAQAIERLKICRECDGWPTGYEAIRTFDWI